MGIIAWIAFGFVVGLIARAIIPGDQKLGFIVTTLVGIGGSFVGGMFGSILGGYPMWQFNTAGIIGSVIGAVVLMFILGLAHPHLHGPRTPRTILR